MIALQVMGVMGIAKGDSGDPGTHNPTVIIFFIKDEVMYCTRILYTSDMALASRILEAS